MKPYKMQPRWIGNRKIKAIQALHKKTTPSKAHRVRKAILVEGSGISENP
jgi:hypothetical protein